VASLLADEVNSLGLDCAGRMVLSVTRVSAPRRVSDEETVMQSVVSGRLDMSYIFGDASTL
jgi:hypothetical protein